MKNQRRTWAVRVYTTTPDRIDKIAANLGCRRITDEMEVKGSTGVLLDRIANGELVVVQSSSST